jgi:hypothetical protein
MEICCDQQWSFAQDAPGSRQPGSRDKDPVDRDNIQRTNTLALRVIPGTHRIEFVFRLGIRSAQELRPATGNKCQKTGTFQCSISIWQKMVVSSIGFPWRSLCCRRFRESKQQLKISCVKRVPSSKYVDDLEKDEFSSRSDWRFRFGQWSLQQQLCIMKNRTRNLAPSRDGNDTFSGYMRLHFDSGDTDRKKSECHTRERSPNWPMFSRWAYNISYHSAIKMFHNVVRRNRAREHHDGGQLSFPTWKACR